MVAVPVLGEDRLSPKEHPLPDACETLIGMSKLVYTKENVARMLESARACSAEKSLVGKSRAFVASYFPSPGANYYAGDWKGESRKSSAWKQVKLVFCFDEKNTVKSVAYAYAHQDLACPE